MNMLDPRNNQNTLWWIGSLAISVTCCSILFVIFAGYIADLKVSLETTRIRFEVTNQRLNEMTADFENLRKHMVQQMQIQIVPGPGSTPGSIQLPVSAMPAEEQPAQPNAAPASEQTPATAPKPAPEPSAKKP